jgi:hypothetical protein
MAAISQDRHWSLQDAEAIARENPYTFWKPSAALIAQLKPGDCAKLVFGLIDPGPDDPNAERMWVQITERDGDRFIGRLDNQPYYIRDLLRGATIVFQPRHVIDASIPDPVPDPTLKWQPRCFVTNRILREGAKVGYFYREAPDNSEDSGWRFMSGDETQTYMEDASNSQFVSLGAVLRHDDRMVTLLDLAAPIAFGWNEDVGDFIETALPPTLP